MTTEELRTDANALMNLEMMDAVVGGRACSDSCTKGCINDCKPSCQLGCSHSGKTEEKRKKEVKRSKK